LFPSAPLGRGVFGWRVPGFRYAPPCYGTQHRWRWGVVVLVLLLVLETMDGRGRGGSWDVIEYEYEYGRRRSGGRETGRSPAGARRRRGEGRFELES
jgi:hypothetical protein